MAYPVNHLRLTFHLSLKRKPKREGKNLVNLFGKRKSQNSNLNKRKKKSVFIWASWLSKLQNFSKIEKKKY